MVKLNCLFDIQYGNSLCLQSLELGGEIAFIARGSENNGIAGYVKKIDAEPFAPHKITVSLGGSVLESFYQDSDFYTAYHINVLTPKTNMTKSQMLYYCMLLRSNNYRYSFGRQANKTLKNLLMPDLTEIPSFVTTVPIPTKPSEKELSPGKKISLRDRRWKKFYYDDIFNIGRGQRLIDEDREKGKIPYFSASETNNGCTDFISNPLFTKRNAILYSTFGDAYWVEGEFTASDEISIFQNDHLNVYNALFITTVMAQNRYKYAFGRKAFRIRFTNDIIKLPVDTHEKPNWQFMEDYIKSLPCSAELATSA